MKLKLMEEMRKTANYRVAHKISKDDYMYFMTWCSGLLRAYALSKEVKYEDYKEMQKLADELTEYIKKESEKC